MGFSELLARSTLSEIKTEILAIAAAAGLKANTWILGRPSERWIEIVARAIDMFTSEPLAQAVRGFFLDFATDPGDPGDITADRTPRPGWLSALGFSWYGVERAGQTYATGFLTLTNTGPSATLPFKAMELTFQRSYLAANNGAPTYRNTSDPSIYTGLGGTLILAPGASVTIPIAAEQLGAYGSATAGSISVAVTQTFGELSCTNASGLVGQEREDPDLYRARCRAAAAKLSPGGPGAAYIYAANTARDGTPLQRFDGSGAVGIARTFVRPSATDGTVLVYYADPDGGADAVDVSSATANTTGIALGVITDPLGVLPDAITILPTVTDPNTGGPGGAAAINTLIPLVGTAKIKARRGVTGAQLIALAQQAIAEELDLRTFPAWPIGGLDQTAGSGFVYQSDIACAIEDAATGIYKVALSQPASQVVILLGHVAVRSAPPAITGAVNAGGLIKITAVGHGITTGYTVQIFGVLGTVEANGTWVITVVDADHFTLDGSAFANAYVSGGTISLIILTVVS